MCRKNSSVPCAGATASFVLNARKAASSESQSRASPPAVVPAAAAAQQSSASVAASVAAGRGRRGGAAPGAIAAPCVRCPPSPLWPPAAACPGVCPMSACYRRPAAPGGSGSGLARSPGLRGKASPAVTSPGARAWPCWRPRVAERITSIAIEQARRCKVPLPPLRSASDLGTGALAPSSGPPGRADSAVGSSVPGHCPSVPCGRSSSAAARRQAARRRRSLAPRSQCAPRQAPRRPGGGQQRQSGGGLPPQQLGRHVA